MKQPINEDMEVLKALVYVYFLLHPNMTGRRIYTIWYKSRIFGEYNRPDKELLHSWVLEYREELTKYVRARTTK